MNQDTEKKLALRRCHLKERFVEIDKCLDTVQMTAMDEEIMRLVLMNLIELKTNLLDEYISLSTGKRFYGNAIEQLLKDHSGASEFYQFGDRMLYMEVLDPKTMGHIQYYKALRRLWTMKSKADAQAGKISLQH